MIIKQHGKRKGRGRNGSIVRASVPFEPARDPVDPEWTKRLHRQAGKPKSIHFRQMKSCEARNVPVTLPHVSMLARDDDPDS